MRPEEALTPSERELMKALAGLKPAATGLDRNKLMFEAGRRSMRGSVLAWRVTSTLLCVGLGLSLFVRPAPRSPQGVEYAGARNAYPPNVASSSAPVDASYLRLQRRVLSEGLDALSADRSTYSRRTPPQPTVDDLVEELSHGT